MLNLRNGRLRRCQRPSWRSTGKNLDSPPCRLLAIGASTRQKPHEMHSFSARTFSSITIQTRDFTVTSEGSSQIDSLHQDRIYGRRRVVACSIPQWLSRDVAWRDRTMELLQLPTGNSQQATEMLQKEYRTFYKSSLKSFAEQLLTPGPPELFGAMDRLADAGFGLTSFSKQYRTMKAFRNRRLSAERSLTNIETSLRRRRRTKEIFEANAERFRATSDDQEEAQQQLSTEIEGKRQQILENMDTEIRIFEVKLERAQRELDEMVPPMDDKTYENARKITLEVLEPICRVFSQHIEERHKSMVEQFQELDLKTDMTKPHEWYPRARLQKRKIIFHGGPTNSGKTYMALERLKEAKRGMYVGPLRLLAAEVYDKLTSAGMYCNLYTGQERREIPFATHGAATVEMASVLDEFDVAVIDEIQMIEDPDRGAAWTRALLGIQSPEIHVCGGLEAKDVVQRMARACGDEFELRTYERFSKLAVDSVSLAPSSETVGSYTKVKPGDCVVAFSKNDIFAIQREIEENTAYKCCVIYGSLPPETRSEQARRFNDPNSGYDILVASDAIAMGLNLSIRRIIFNTIYKHDGSGTIRLGHSAIKQISGRAGRRNSPYPVGAVTCRAPEDLPYVKECMGTDITEIDKAGLMPTTNHIEVFSNALFQQSGGQSDHQLHSILLRFNDMARIQSDFFMCRQTEMYQIAKFLASHQIPIRDKYSLCMCPIQMSCKASMDTLSRFAAKLAAGEVSGLKRMKVPHRPKSFEDLGRLCSIFSQLDVFLWLQKKFPRTGNVMEEQTALSIRHKTIAQINQSLKQTEGLTLEHCYMRRDLRMRESWLEEQGGDSDDEEEDISNEGLQLLQ